LLLRTVGISQEEVAQTVSVGKKKVVAVEKWFKALKYEEAISFCYDHAVDCAIVIELHNNQWLQEKTEVKINKLGATSILMHYGHVKPSRVKIPRIKPRPSEHHAHLAVVAEKIRWNIKAVKEHKEAVINGNIVRGYLVTKEDGEIELQDADRLDSTCLLDHLRYMYPDFQEIKDWESINSYKQASQVSNNMLGHLKEVSHGLALKGSCKICQSWFRDSRNG